MTRPLGLFEGVGVELEYMIVDAATLDVKPMADRLIAGIAGEPVSEIERGPVAWSNELVLHVLELKTNGPARDLTGLAALFQGDVRQANDLLDAEDARLMSGGMHPWMDPRTEMRLWPHEYNDVYKTFDRIFHCEGHGWANLQSTHLNLPFSDDAEFGRLHSAVRAVLPLIPALAASSPFQEGARGGFMDGRVAAYRENARRVPSVTARVVPEVVKTRDQYETEILEPIYRDLAPLDPEGVLRHEWVNSRGAIARFERQTVEIRLIDAQECPAADLAVAAAVHAAVRWLTLDPPEGTDAFDTLDTPRLAQVLDQTVRDGNRTTITDDDYLRALGFRRNAPSAGRVWRHIVDASLAHETGSGEWAAALEVILEDGCLARRILQAVGTAPGHAALPRVYRRVCECLASGQLFRNP